MSWRFFPDMIFYLMVTFGLSLVGDVSPQYSEGSCFVCPAQFLSGKINLPAFVTVNACVLALDLYNRIANIYLYSCHMLHPNYLK